jgi:hypothetical protein
VEVEAVGEDLPALGQVEAEGRVLLLVGHGERAALRHGAKDAIVQATAHALAAGGMPDGELDEDEGVYKPALDQLGLE